jgi:hypothetical protein
MRADGENTYQLNLNALVAWVVAPDHDLRAVIWGGLS